MNLVQTMPSPRVAFTFRPYHPQGLASWWALVGCSAVLLLVYTAAALLDARQLAGDSVWLKPAKFALSLAVLFATLAPVVARLSDEARNRRGVRWTLTAMTWAFTAEMAYITLQAGRGVHSHFNLATPWEATMYAVMGVGAVTLVAGTAALGTVVLRDRTARISPMLRMGIGLGFWLSTVLTLVTAGYLSSRGGHFVGAHPAGGTTVPLMGWSLVVGDLRPSHFLALHAMQALPALGWWLDRRSLAHPSRWMAAAAIGYTLLTLSVFAQALMGRPLLG